MGPNVILLLLIITISSNVVLTQNKIDVNVIIDGELYTKRIINSKSNLISELDSIIHDQKQKYKSIEKSPEFWNVYYKNKLINNINDSTLNNLHNNDYLYLYYNQKGLNEMYSNVDVLDKILALVKKVSSKSNDSSDGFNIIDRVELINIAETILTSDYFKTILQTLLFEQKGLDWNLVYMILTNSSLPSTFKSVLSSIGNSLLDNMNKEATTSTSTNNKTKDDKKQKTILNKKVNKEEKKTPLDFTNVDIFKTLNKRFNNSKKTNKKINKKRSSNNNFEKKKKQIVEVFKTFTNSIFNHS